MNPSPYFVDGPIQSVQPVSQLFVGSFHAFLNIVLALGFSLYAELLFRKSHMGFNLMTHHVKIAIASPDRTDFSQPIA